MKTMVHNSKALTKALAAFITDNIGIPSGAFEVSDVKQDGTVFVKFRSYRDWPASMLAQDFAGGLTNHAKLFVQTTNVQFRLALDQFRA